MSHIKNIIILIFFFLDKIFNKLFNISLKYSFLKQLDDKNYKKILIHQNYINFYVPNSVCNFRVDTFYEKEPETLNWIDGFKINSKQDNFWDIGANIGLYSIYAATKHKNINVFSFEPSTSNLRVLSRNISINNLNSNIQIVPIAIGESKEYFSKFYESNFEEGGALNSFKYDKNFAGNKLDYSNSYNILGLSLDELIEKTNINCPKYIKIDVDGLEHLVLKGSEKLLKLNELREIFIEVNQDYAEQFKTVTKLMKENNFSLFSKQNSEMIKKSKEFSHTFNYHFIKNI